MKKFRYNTAILHSAVLLHFVYSLVCVAGECPKYTQRKVISHRLRRHVQEQLCYTESSTDWELVCRCMTCESLRQRVCRVQSRSFPLRGVATIMAFCSWGDMTRAFGLVLGTYDKDGRSPRFDELAHQAAADRLRSRRKAFYLAMEGDFMPRTVYVHLGSCQGVLGHSGCLPDSCFGPFLGCLRPSTER